MCFVRSFGAFRIDCRLLFSCHRYTIISTRTLWIRKIHYNKRQDRSADFTAVHLLFGNRNHEAGNGLNSTSASKYARLTESIYGSVGFASLETTQRSRVLWLQNCFISHSDCIDNSRTTLILCLYPNHSNQFFFLLLFQYYVD